MINPPSIADLPVRYYKDRRIPNPKPREEKMCWYEYYAARNLIVSHSRNYGTVGPLAEREVVLADEEPDNDDDDDWSRGDDDPTYWVVDDWYNEEMYIYVEVEPEGLTSNWLAGMVQVLKWYLPGWGVCIMGADDNYMILFADRLMATGPGLKGCRNVESAVAARRSAMLKAQANKERPAKD